MRRAVLLLLFISSAALGATGTLADALRALGMDSLLSTLLLAGVGGVITSVGKIAPGRAASVAMIETLKDIVASLGAGMGFFLASEYIGVDKMLEALVIFVAGLMGAVALNILRGKGGQLLEGLLKVKPSSE